MNARSPRPSVIAAAVVAGLLLGGCAWWRGQPPASDIEHPVGDALVLRVYTSGGFVPADFQLTNLPSITLLGDGRVIVTGPHDASYPGPALPNLLVRQLSETGMQAVLRRAIDTGELDRDASWEGAGSRVADAPDTVFLLHADGRDVTVRVYALGLVGIGFPDMTPDERRVHVSLGSLLADLTDLDSWVASTGWADPEWTSYQPETLRLLVRNADGDTPGPDGMTFQPAAWPTPSIDPATFGEAAWNEQTSCGVVTGQAAVDWYAALSRANQLTRWVDGDHRYQVLVRPLLPDEPADCEPLR